MNDKFIPSKEWYSRELNAISADIKNLEREMGWRVGSMENHRFDKIINGIAIIENLLRSDERII